MSGKITINDPPSIDRQPVPDQMTGTSVPKNQRPAGQQPRTAPAFQQTAAEMRIKTAAAVAAKGPGYVFGQWIKHRQMHGPNRLQTITAVGQNGIFQPQALTELLPAAQRPQFRLRQKSNRGMKMPRAKKNGHFSSTQTPDIPSFLDSGFWIRCNGQ